MDEKKYLEHRFIKEQAKKYTEIEKTYKILLENRQKRSIPMKTPRK